MTINKMNIDELREQLIKLCLDWEKLLGVAPHITGAISEFDAMKLIGMSEKEILDESKDKTSRQKGHDFIHNDVKYQVKANRPSYRKNSPVTITAKAKNYDFDKLIWILYNQEFVIQEAYEWNVNEYKEKCEFLKQVRPVHLRQGKRVA